MKRRSTTILFGLATATLMLWAPAPAGADEACPPTDLTCVTQTVGGTVDDTVGTVGQVANDPSSAVGTVRDTVHGAIGTVRNIVDDTTGGGSGGGGTDPTGGGGSGAGGGSVTGTDGAGGAGTGGSGHGNGAPGTSAQIQASARTDPSPTATQGTSSADATSTSGLDRHAASRARIGHVAAAVAAGAAALFVLGALMFGFLLVQDRLDARDPRLAASSRASDRVAFG